jgi:coproporphyrinogen III oxidase-like Fe-S oxidoreductase
MLFTSFLRIILTHSFKPFIFYGRARDSLEFETIENLGLYIHIPFCRSICNFCPYNKELYNIEKASCYKQALLSEIDIACKDLKVKKKVTSLYFGGGTPALMSADVKDIIVKLNDYFEITDGIGIELHPDDVNSENLSIIQSAGITMVSIGIQSFDRDCLAKIGREYNEFEEKIRLAKNFGFSVVDVDLIFAIPGQTKSKLYNDIKTAFHSGATQVSTYPFIDFTFANNEYEPLPKVEKKKLLKFLVSISRDLHLERTSVWTFAKKDTGKYSTVTRDNFLGFGVSATTLLTDTFKINTFSVDAYINTVSKRMLPTALTLEFTLRQRAAYFLFWSAYKLTIRTNDFKCAIGTSIEKVFGFELWLSRHFGLLEKIDGGYKLTEKASYLYHSIEQVYTTAYIDKMWNIARKEPFPQKICLK